MFLVVGLGNPGKDYDGTKHNVGFELVDSLARRLNAPRWKSELRAETCKVKVGNADVLLVKPQTYMNLSGESVQALAHYYKVEPASVIVAHDELDFEPGTVKLKVGGGHGGNNGLRSIIAHLGADFVRLRIGIGKPPQSDRGADWVLSRFNKATRPLIDDALIKADQAIESIIVNGVAKAMNAINQAG
ncbi:MAG: aminoacyl-tRNA hydrolase [Myxococcota bacterium]